MEVGGHRIIPAEVELIDRLGIVADRSVIAARCPFIVQSWRGGGGQCLGNLAHRLTPVHAPHGLIVQPAVIVALRGEPCGAFRLPEDRPAMAGNHHFALRAVTGGRFVEVMRPCARIAHLRAARGEDVVQRAGGDFSSEEGLFRCDEHVEFRRSLAARNDLEFQRHTVNLAGFASRGDGGGRRDQRQRAARYRHADPAAHLAGWAGRHPGGKLIGRAPQHRSASHDIFRRGFFHEAFGRDHLRAACGNVCRINHPAHAAEMVGMAVRIDDRADCTLAERRVHQLHRRARGFDAGERVDHDPASLPANDRHVRQVKAAHLPDIVRHLIQPVVFQVAHMPPQAGVDSVGRRAIDKGIGGKVPDRLAAGIADHRIGAGGDKAAGGKIAIARAFGGQGGCCDGLRGAGRIAGGRRPGGFLRYRRRAGHGEHCACPISHHHHRSLSCRRIAVMRVSKRRIKERVMGS